MQPTYAVVWREGAVPLARGKLELLGDGLRLTGVAGSRHVSREVAYADIAAVRVGRSHRERLNGVPSLVLESSAGPVVLAVVAQSSGVGELAERLGSLTR